MIAAGELREIIKIQRPVRNSDNFGGYETTYTDIIAKTYAKVVEESSNNPLIANQENVVNTVKFRIRYRPVLFIKNGDCLVWRGFNYTINNIKVDPVRTYIEITVDSIMQTSER